MFTDWSLDCLDWISKLAGDNGRYIKYAEEVGGGDEPRPHFQGFFVLKKKWRFAQVRSFLDENGGGDVHVEQMRGSVKDNDEYVGKEGGPVHEHGSRVGILAGEKKAKTAQWRDMLKDGVKLTAVIDESSGALLHMRQLREYQNMLNIERVPTWREVRVLVFYGNTGVGKTRLATEMTENAYMIHPNANEWWPGYDMHDHVIIDDYASQWPVTRMLHLLDGYRVQLPYKGGFSPASYTLVVITSNIHPSQWYPIDCTEQHRAALLRRINSVFRIEDCECIIDESTSARVGYRAIEKDCDKHGNAPGH